MSHYWRWQDAHFDHFHPSEFDRPEMMSVDFLAIIDHWRSRCGFPIEITSDGRDERMMAAIYGPDRSTWPNSPHKRGHAVDAKPKARGVQEADTRRMVMVREALKMWEEGIWPRLGLEVATAHLHVDNDTQLRRPHLWVGVSR